MPKIQRVEERGGYDAMEAAVRKIARKYRIVIGRDAVITEYSYGSMGDLEIEWVKNGFVYRAKREGYRGY
jgi:hypothetical protein